MAALESLSDLIGINSNQITKDENWILEAELYMRTHQELWNAYKTQHKDYCYLIQTNFEKENAIMELSILRSLINDLLKSDNYTLSGIAYYTQMPEEMIEDLYMGNKISPVIVFIRKLIELHKAIKPEIYQNILKKITPEKKQ